MVGLVFTFVGVILLVFDGVQILARSGKAPGFGVKGEKLCKEQAGGGI